MPDARPGENDPELTELLWAVIRRDATSDPILTTTSRRLPGQTGTGALGTPTTGVRQSIGRTEPSSCAGQRAARRSDARPQARPRIPAMTGPKSPSNQSVKIVTGAFGSARGR